MKQLLLAILFLALLPTLALAGYGGELEVNAATDVKVGPFVDVDGITPQADIGDPGTDLDGVDTAYLMKHSSADNEAIDITSGDLGLTWDDIDNATGYYNLSLTASEVDTEGMLTITITDNDECLPVSMHYMVLSEAAYNSKYGVDDDDSGYMRVDVMESGDTAQTANDNGADINTLITGVNIASCDADAIEPGDLKTDAIDADALAADAATEIIDNFETQSAADPTEFNVNIKEINDIATQLQFLMDASTTINADADLTTIVVDKSILSHVMTPAANTDTYRASTDSLEAIKVFADTIKAETVLILADTDDIGAAGIGLTDVSLATDAVDADALKADAATQITNDWESQSQTDPTGFHVNLYEINDVVTQLQMLIDATTTKAADEDLEPVVVAGSVIAHIAATGADITTFKPSTDSLQSTRDAITEANPQNHTCDSVADNAGTPGASVHTEVHTDDGTDFTCAPDGGGIDQEFTFTMGTGRTPLTVQINGYFAADPPGAEVVDVYAYNYVTTADEAISDGATQMDDQAADQNYQYSLTADHYQVADGEVKISLKSTSTDTDEILYLDMIHLTSVASEASGLSLNAIEEGVWNHPYSHGHDEGSMGYVLGHISVSYGTLDSATDATQFKITSVQGALSSNNDAYNGMLIRLEDKTDDVYEVRRIIDYIAADPEIIVDKAFSFTPVAADDYYIMSTGYSDVNISHVGGTAQTANDMSGDIDDVKLWIDRAPF